MGSPFEEMPQAAPQEEQEAKEASEEEVKKEEEMPEEPVSDAESSAEKVEDGLEWPEPIEGRDEKIEKGEKEMADKEKGFFDGLLDKMRQNKKFRSIVMLGALTSAFAGGMLRSPDAYAETPNKPTIGERTPEGFPEAPEGFDDLKKKLETAREFLDKANEGLTVVHHRQRTIDREGEGYTYNSDTSVDNFEFQDKDLVVKSMFADIAEQNVESSTEEGRQVDSEQHSRIETKILQADNENKIEGTGQITEASGIGETQEDAIRNAVRNAAGNFETDVDSDLYSKEIKETMTESENGQVDRTSKSEGRLVKYSVNTTDVAIEGYKILDVKEVDMGDGKKGFEVQIEAEKGKDKRINNYNLNI